nr:Chain B, RSG-1.2 PEPTIDE [synthetic construct]
RRGSRPSGAERRRRRAAAA